MPRVEVVYYQESDGTVPMLDWLDSLPLTTALKCLARLERLEAMGHELRRPEADCLRHGVYELRVKHSRLNYRMLYFFRGRRAVVVSHGFSKQQSAVPTQEIDLAIRRKIRFESHPGAHSFQPEC